MSENKIESFEQITNEIKSVTLQEVISCAKEFYKQQNYVVSAVGACKKSDLMAYKH